MVQYRVFDSISGHYLESCSYSSKAALVKLESLVHYTMYDRHELHEFTLIRGELTNIKVYKVKVTSQPRATI